MNKIMNKEFFILLFDKIMLAILSVCIYKLRKCCPYFVIRNVLVDLLLC
jgi:hypothetical protein